MWCDGAWTLCDADIISAVEFDKSGEHLATGDRGGRVVLFERLHPSKATLVRARPPERLKRGTT